MTRPASICLVFFAAVAACSSNGHPASTDATLDGDAAPVDGGGEADVALDAQTSATCQQIRLCVAAGGGVDACLARGTPDAQVIFMNMLACLQPSCPDLLSACVCRETCQQPDGFCLDEADACLTESGGSVDAVCDHYCGG